MIPYTKDIAEAIEWRYDRYVAPFRTFYRDPVWLARYLASNIRGHLSSKRLAYVYADPTNSGDYASHLGVRMLAGVPGVQVFCAHVGRKLVARHGSPWAGAIIGGGGLLQPCFKDFWISLLKSSVPFAIFGVGENVLPPFRNQLDPQLLSDIAGAAKLIHVRDQATFDLFDRYKNNSLSVGLCPSVNYLQSVKERLNVPTCTTLLHVIHKSDLKFSGVSLERTRERLMSIAGDLKLAYEETHHCCGLSRGLLRKYMHAACVVSSRLHGCIFALALEKPLYAISCDDKVRRFVDTHGVSGRCVSGDMVEQDLSNATIAEAMRQGPIPLLSSALCYNEERMKEALRVLGI